MRLATAIALVPAMLLASCLGVRRGPPSPAGYPEATSLLGAPLYALEQPLERRQLLEANLSQAYAGYERDPDNAEAIIWLGRSVAFLGRYRDAIGIFSEGIRKHPDDPRMYRHRGHRWITVREFDLAARDLEQAARLLRRRPDEPERAGLLDSASAPLGTLHFNVWSHLGLAYYLRGDFNRAQYGFRNALAVSTHDDARAAATDWLYMTLRRAGRTEEAASVLASVTAEMNVQGSAAYQRRLLMYRGVIPPDSLLRPNGGDATTLATEGYGVGNWYLYNERPDQAEEIFWQVTSAENWTAFGYIAAEADLRRLLRRRRR